MVTITNKPQIYYNWSLFSTASHFFSQ